MLSLKDTLGHRDTWQHALGSRSCLSQFPDISDIQQEASGKELPWDNDRCAVNMTFLEQK